MSKSTENFVIVAVGISLLCIAIPGGTWLKRLMDDPATRVCRVEAMNPAATLVIKIEDMRDSCSPRALAQEARSAIRTVLEEENDAR